MPRAASSSRSGPTSGRAGSLGFLAGGYKSPEALGEQIATTRAAGVAFGVNLFAPNPLPIGRSEYERYAEAIEISLRYLSEVSPSDLACPTAVQLCYLAGDFDRLRKLSRERGDLLNYVAQAICGAGYQPVAMGLRPTKV